MRCHEGTGTSSPSLPRGSATGSSGVPPEQRLKQRRPFSAVPVGKRQLSSNMHRSTDAAFFFCCFYASEAPHTLFARTRIAHPTATARPRSGAHPRRGQAAVSPHPLPFSSRPGPGAPAEPNRRRPLSARRSGSYRWPGPLPRRRHHSPRTAPSEAGRFEPGRLPYAGRCHRPLPRGAAARLRPRHGAPTACRPLPPPPLTARPLGAPGEEARRPADTPPQAAGGGRLR